MRTRAIFASVLSLVGLFIPFLGFQCAIAGLIISIMGLKGAIRARIPHEYMSTAYLARALNIAAIILQFLYMLGWGFFWVKLLLPLL